MYRLAFRPRAQERAPNPARGSHASTLSRLCDADGQALATVALMMSVILLIVALVCDVGYGYVVRRQMQNAADAGALAGARELLVGSDAVPVATDYAERNGADDVTVVVNEAQYSVRVIAQKTVPTFMAGVVGLSELTISAAATAIWGSVDRVTSELYPIAVEWDDFVYGETYDIYEGLDSSNFGWLSWDGCGDTGCLIDWLSPGGYGGGVSLGDWIPGNTGVSNSADVRDALAALFNRPLIIVVWDEVRGQGASAEFHVAGFATFIPEDIDLPQKRITGRFIEWSYPTTSIEPGGGYGARGTKLVE